MKPRLAALILAAVALAGSPVRAGSSFGCKPGQQGSIFSFKPSSAPIKFDWGKCLTPKTSYLPQCNDLPKFSSINFGNLFNKSAPSCDLGKWKKLICKSSGWKNPFNHCKPPTLTPPCDPPPAENNPLPPSDEPSGNTECPVVPVPAAGWAGLTLLGGLALFRKIRRDRRQTHVAA